HADREHEQVEEQRARELRDRDLRAPQRGDQAGCQRDGQRRRRGAEPDAAHLQPRQRVAGGDDQEQENERLLREARRQHRSVLSPRADAVAQYSSNRRWIALTSVVFSSASCSSTRALPGFSSPDATKFSLSSSTSLLRSTRPLSSRVL